MIVDPAGLGDRLRELSAEVADGATVWCSTLNALAEQADVLERDRAQWRATMTRVRAEAYSWTNGAEPTNDDLRWCAARIRFALDG